MKNLKSKLLFRPKVAVGVLASALLSTLVFQNCSKGVLQDSSVTAASTISQSSSNTVGVVTTRQIYNSMLSVSKLNIGNSTLAPADLAALGASVSSTGTSDSVNGPMWMALTSLSGLNCIDVMANEASLAKAGQTPNFIVQVNLWATPPAIQDSQIQDTVNRFARSFWGRNATSDESAMITADLSASFSSVRTGTPGAAGNPATDAVNPDTNRMMFYLCTAMLASMDTHKRVSSN